MSDTLTMREIEALAAFLARRSELWAAEEVEMGIDPLGVPTKLAHAYSHVVNLLRPSVDRKMRRCTDPAKL